jgi:hypothetical protein
MSGMTLTGYYATRIRTYVHEGIDATGARLRATFTPAGLRLDGTEIPSEWSVSTHAEGDETSVMVQFGSPVADLSDMFRTASAVMRFKATA